MKMGILNDIMNHETEPLELGINYEFIITDPETSRNIVYEIKKVGYYMNVHPESIMNWLLKYYADIQKDFDNSPNSVCHKGCCDCCTNDFEISITEYFMILKFLGIKYGDDYIKQYSDIAKKSMSSSKCIFVDCTNGACSIYEVRPLICRKYGLYDYTNYNCEKLNSDKDLLTYKPDTSNGTFCFKHSVLSKKEIMCPCKRIVHWFGNLKDGQLASEKMKKLFYASFNEPSDVFVETLFM